MFNKNGKIKIPTPSEIAEKVRQKQEEKKQKEIEAQNEEQFILALKLSEWEIANGIRVESILRKPVRADSVSFIAVRYLHKMSDEEKAEYIKIINAEKYEYEKLTKEQNSDIPSEEIQGQGDTREGNKEDGGGKLDPK